MLHDPDRGEPMPAPRRGQPRLWVVIIPGCALLIGLAAGAFGGWKQRGWARVPEGAFVGAVVFASLGAAVGGVVQVGA